MKQNVRAAVRVGNSSVFTAPQAAETLPWRPVTIQVKHGVERKFQTLGLFVRSPKMFNTMAENMTKGGTGHSNALTLTLTNRELQ